MSRVERVPCPARYCGPGCPLCDGRGVVRRWYAMVIAPAGCEALGAVGVQMMFKGRDAETVVYYMVVDRRRLTEIVDLLPRCFGPDADGRTARPTLRKASYRPLSVPPVSGAGADSVTESF